MDGGTGGWTGGRMDNGRWGKGWGVEGCVGRWMGRWTGRWIDERMDGQWMGGRMGWLSKDDDQMNHTCFNYLHKCYLHTDMFLGHLKVNFPNHPATCPPPRFLTALF